MQELFTDPAREHLGAIAPTGIYVRALDKLGNWQSVDIITLTDRSLRKWLKGDPDRAVNTVSILLGHKPKPTEGVTQA